MFAARKLKKIGQQKNPEEDHPVQDAAEAVQSAAPSVGLNLNSQLVFLNILEAIEPEVVNAGHDYGQPDSAASLLTSLNELGERQLVKVVKWAKGLPGRRSLKQKISFILVLFCSLLLNLFVFFLFTVKYSQLFLSAGIWYWWNELK